MLTSSVPFGKLRQQENVLLGSDGLDDDLKSAYPTDKHGNFIRDPKRSGPFAPFLRSGSMMTDRSYGARRNKINRLDSLQESTNETDQVDETFPRGNCKPKLKKKKTIDFRTAIPSMVKGTKMPFGDPSDLNPEQPRATGSTEPPPGHNTSHGPAQHNVPQASASAAQPNYQNQNNQANQSGQGSSDPEKESAASPPNIKVSPPSGQPANPANVTNQQNLLYSWSRPVQGPDMPTPTVFRNDRTEHSNVVVEGIIVQRAFFSNPPSEYETDSEVEDAEF